MLSRKQRPLLDRTDQSKQRPFSSSSSSASSSNSASAATPSAAAAAGNGGKVDRLLFNNHVDLVPLERKKNPASMRRASMMHTPAPPQSKKVTSIKPGSVTKSVPPAKKQRDITENTPKINKDKSTKDKLSNSSRTSSREDLKKQREELALLQVQVSELEKKLVEKEEALKLAEISIDQMSMVNDALDDVRHQLAEKESLVKSANSELYDAKIALADKQAAVEKLEWEAKMSSRKVEELQGNVSSMNDEISILMDFFAKLSPNDSNIRLEDSNSSLDSKPIILEDDIGELDREKMEEEIVAYMSALADARSNPSDEFLTTLTEERLRFQALVL